MVRITVELIRKRSEHNEGEISTLEEISLHQENIEKIELLGQLCRDLKILLMQNNLIAKLENLNKFKKLEYLNLALNNIEVIENLEGVESLKKLDLTVNFIGDLQGVKTLRYNEHLEQLFLTGNPCTDYQGYRDYVIATLPQLSELDMTEITRSERIKSLQRHAEVEGDIIRGYKSYAKKRAKQIDEYQQTRLKIDDDKLNDDESEDKVFWSSVSHHTPEDRRAIADKSVKVTEKKNNSQEKNSKPKYIPKLFSPEGRPYNINQARLQFTLNDEDDRENIILEVPIYRYLDTSLVNVDVQPHYVRVTIKGKILQLSLPCEIQTDASVSSRNTVTGRLVVTMPRLNPLSIIVKPCVHSSNKVVQNKSDLAKVVRSIPTSSKRELLEIGPPRDELELLKIYKNAKDIAKNSAAHSQEFQDDPEVPPLE